MSSSGLPTMTRGRVGHAVRPAISRRRHASASRRRRRLDDLNTVARQFLLKLVNDALQRLREEPDGAVSVLAYEQDAGDEDQRLAKATLQAAPSVLLVARALDHDLELTRLEAAGVVELEHLLDALEHNLCPPAGDAASALARHD